MAIGLRVTEHELASLKFGHQYCFVAAYVYIYIYICIGMHSILPGTASARCPAKLFQVGLPATERQHFLW